MWIRIAANIIGLLSIYETFFLVTSLVQDVGYMRLATCVIPPTCEGLFVITWDEFQVFCRKLVWFASFQFNFALILMMYVNCNQSSVFLSFELKFYSSVYCFNKYFSHASFLPQHTHVYFCQLY